MFSADFYELIESMMAKATKRRIRKAIVAAKCIREGCNEPQFPGGRQACKKHWNQFRYGRRLAKKRGASVLKKYEKDEVSAGRIGPSRRGCSCKNDYKARAIGAAAT